MVVLVGDAVDLVVGRERDGIPVEPVGAGLEQHEDADEDRQVRLRGTAHAIVGGEQAQPAVEVVHDDGSKESQHHRGEQEAEDKAEERQVEDVERHVHAEQRIRGAERRAVAEQQPVLPLRGGAHTGQQSEHQRYAEQRHLAQRVQRRAVALEAVLLGRHHPEHRAHAVGDPHVDAHDERHHAAEDDEQTDAGPELGGEDRGGIDRLEPQEVGVEAGHDHQHQCQDADHDQGPDQRAAAAGPVSHVDPTTPTLAACRRVERHERHPTVRFMVVPSRSSSALAWDDRRVSSNQPSVPDVPAPEGVPTPGLDPVTEAQRGLRLLELAREVERYVATEGWDQNPRIFALARTVDLVAMEPEIAEALGADGEDPESITPIEQEPLDRDRPLDEVLATTMWPRDVVGAAIALERVMLPPSAEQTLSDADDPTALEAAVNAHPERQDVRMAVVVLRDGRRMCALRLRSHDGDADVLVGEDLVPSLADALAATLT